MFVCNKFKVVFVHIRKTAGTSILRAFIPHLDIKAPFPRTDRQRTKGWYRPFHEGNIHETLSEILRRRSLRKGYKVFSVVRNPYTRVASMYCNRGPKHGTSWQMLMSFDAYLRSENKELISQADSLRGHTEPPRTLRFETLAKDFKAFCKEIGANLNLLHMNNNRVRSDYSDLYTPSAIDLVTSLYKIDIDMFEYKYPYE